MGQEGPGWGQTQVASQVDFSLAEAWGWLLGP